MSSFLFQPPELAGRDEIISDADIALQRVLLGRHDKSQILLGLRGTGKTVLLNKIEELAESHHHLTSFIEAPDKRRLADMLYPKLQQVLRKLPIRLFNSPPVGPLNKPAATSAIEQPILAEGERITKAAIELICDKTEGYPYFLEDIKMIMDSKVPPELD